MSHHPLSKEYRKKMNKIFPGKRRSFVGSSSTVTFKNKSNFLNNTTSGIFSLLWYLRCFIIYTPCIQILMVYVNKVKIIMFRHLHFNILSVLIKQMTWRECALFWSCTSQLFLWKKQILKYIFFRYMVCSSQFKKCNPSSSTVPLAYRNSGENRSLGVKNWVRCV